MEIKYTLEILTKDIQDIEKLVGMIQNSPGSSTLELDLALSKLRNDERGARYAYEQLRSHGAPRLGPGEDGRTYVRRVQGLFQKLRHPGNHTYVWALDRRARRQLPACIPPGIRQ